MWPMFRAASCAVLFVPDVKVRTEAQYSPPPANFHELLLHSFKLLIYTYIYIHTHTHRVTIKAIDTFNVM